MSRPAEGRATLRDVARRAQVSLSTASRVLSGSPTVDDALRRRVLEAVRDLGYPTGDALRQRREAVVATVLSGNLRGGLENFPSTASTMLGISRRCAALGLPNAVLMTETDTFPQALYSPNIRACIFAGTGDAESDGLIRFLSGRGIPVVLVNRESALPGVSTIGPDSAAVMDDAVGYLADLGHTRVAHINAVNSLRLAKLRRQGFADAMERRGLPLGEDYCFTGGFDEETGQAAAERFLALPEPPTAILADSDQIAMGVCRFCRARGVEIPGALSVMGMDDIGPAALTQPPLTTVRLFYAETGEEAVNIAETMLRTGGRICVRAVVRHALMPRGTVREPNERGAAI